MSDLEEQTDPTDAKSNMYSMYKITMRKITAYKWGIIAVQKIQVI